MTIATHGSAGFNPEDKQLLNDYLHDFGDLFRNLLDYHQGDLYKAIDAIENKSLGEDGDDYYIIHTKGVRHIYKR
jgi:hypothetical protein